MSTFYIVRTGWNAANQSSRGAKAKPRNRFESRQCVLVAIGEAETPEEAKKQFTGTVYSNQHLTAYSNPRAVAGLTEAIRDFVVVDQEALADAASL